MTTPAGVSPVVPGDQFTYTAGPIVTDVKPRIGPPAGGAQIAITGLQLTGATGVSFGGTPATSFTVNSDTSITAAAPGGTGVVDVTVTGPKGTSPKGVTTQLQLPERLPPGGLRRWSLLVRQRALLRFDRLACT